MATWHVSFTNASLVPWVVAIWQELPDAPDLRSVSWKQAQANPSPEPIPFGWDDTYAAALARYEPKPPSGVFVRDASRPAKAGSTWEIITLDGTQFLGDSGPGPDPEIISILNASDRSANPGLVQSGSGVAYAHDLAVGNTANFSLQPKYWIGLFADLEPGQVIDRSLIVVGPQPLQFPPGVDSLIAAAVLQGQTIVLTVVPA